MEITTATFEEEIRKRCEHYNNIIEEHAAILNYDHEEETGEETTEPGEVFKEKYWGGADVYSYCEGGPRSVITRAIEQQDRARVAAALNSAHARGQFLSMNLEQYIAETARVIAFLFLSHKNIEEKCRQREAGYAFLSVLQCVLNVEKKPMARVLMDDKIKETYTPIFNEIYEAAAIERGLEQSKQDAQLPTPPALGYRPGRAGLL